MNPLSTSIRFASLLCVASLAGCASSPDELILKDPRLDLGVYKTFAFNVPVKTSAVQQATREQMQRLGYVYDERSPDLRVRIKLRVEEHSAVRWASAGNLAYRAWSPDNAETVTYRDGTLYVDLVDARTNTTVWHGVARQGRISSKDSDKAGEVMHAAIRDLFADCPRKA